MERSLYSAIDACLNRAAEGMRVCEDILRFHLRRDDLSPHLKELRHRLFAAAAAFPRRELLHARDVPGDARKFDAAPSQKGRATVAETLGANLHRAMEAARTLEETAKLADAGHADAGPAGTGRGEAAAGQFQEIRFALYDLEKRIVAAVSVGESLGFFRRSLYAIVDAAFVKESCVATAAQMIQGGAKILQLRMKGASPREYLEEARRMAALCRERNVLFIVNDHPDIAMLVDAGGVHLGQEDLPVSEARRLLPASMIIGVSTHSVEEARAAMASRPDYCAVGPLFGTTSKSALALQPVGTGLVRQVRAETEIPLVGIGGITAENAGECLAAGCDSLAVISCLYRDGKIEDNCRAMVDAIGAVAVERPRRV